MCAVGVDAAWKGGPEMSFEGRLKGKEVADRGARIDVAFGALLCSESGNADAVILNLSACGFLLRSKAALRPGAEVTLQVAKLPPVKALVRWVRGQDAGGVFVDPMAL
jgi:hypothetical protein